MLKLEKDNQKVGNYLKSLIIPKYPNVRRFCIAYLQKERNREPSDEEIAKMQNRMSQIIKGNKSIQIYDLPIVCDLLGVSCEQILSGGKCFVPISGHITNYEVAFSKSPKVWKEYLEREDKLFLNPDEYNKTVIDYAMEFKNYDFLKYLMDKKYIWFIDDDKCDCTGRAFGFGAGTSIKRREVGFQDSLGTELEYHSEERGLRQKMIALAMENGDFDTLTELRAREIPTLYQFCVYSHLVTKSSDYYNEDVINEISKASDRVLEYFSDVFQITDHFGRDHWFIYPFLSQVIEKMIKNKCKYTEMVLRKALDHNQKVYSELSKMIAEAFEISKNKSEYSKHFKLPIKCVIEDTMALFVFNSDEGFVSYMYENKQNDCRRFCTNVITVNAESNDSTIDSLISQVNQTYALVKDIQPDSSND